jgi:transposase
MRICCLLQHRDKLRRLSPDSEATRRVQNLVEERRHLVEEKTAQSNRLTNPLKIYFPQMLEWFDRLDTELVCALLEQWPTLEELQKVPPARLRTFFRKQRCHYPELVERRLIGIRQAMPAIRDRAVIEAKSAVVKVSAQTDPQSNPGGCGSGPQDRGGGGSASRFFHL